MPGKLADKSLAADEPASPALNSKRVACTCSHVPSGNTWLPALPPHVFLSFGFFSLVVPASAFIPGVGENPQ